jgi:GH15 family glucan-1,4-alpha-glucosidase
MDLYQSSIQVILKGQAPSGAYGASPDFPPYAFCWLRDGSFIAHAMDLVGEHGSAKAFFRWAAQAIQRCGWKVDRALAQVKAGRPLGHDDYLHTRFTLDGEEGSDLWWNFQLDGYGTWLWALSEHIAMSADSTLEQEVADGVSITVRYLSNLWMLPNYDCWEEYAGYLHPYTLASIYAGLQGAMRLGHQVDNQTTGIMAAIRKLVLSHGCHDNRLLKAFIPESGPRPALSEPQLIYYEQAEVEVIRQLAESSLIGIATPYKLLDPDDPIMQATISYIEKDLHRPNGGVYRYLVDTYYGGGEWVILAAWLGWHHARCGNTARARDLLGWIESVVDENGYLPEQVSTHLLFPDRFAEWETRWGPVAQPLLWSHAMVLILYEALRRNQEEAS